MFRHLLITLGLLCALLGTTLAQAFTPPVWVTKHGAQGTGNYKGKRDRHEKPTPMHEKKRKSANWVPKK